MRGRFFKQAANFFLRGNTFVSLHHANVVYAKRVMQTKLTFYKSYYRMGWWAARTPATGDWADHSVDVLGFGTTQTQAERDLTRKEQAQRFAGSSEIAA